MHNVLIIIAFGVSFFFAASSMQAQSEHAAEIDQRIHNADSLRKRIKYADAWTQLAMIDGLFSELTPTQLAKYYKARGATQVGLERYSDALESYSKSKKYLKNLDTPKSRVDLVNIYTFQGTVYNKTGDYEQARSIFLKGIDEAQHLPEEDRLKALKYLYNNLGECYELLGQYDNAVRTNHKALKLVSQLGQEISVGAGVAHNNLGICYKKLGRYNLANEHYNIAADIFTESLGPKSRYTLAALSNAAVSIDKFGDAEKAIPILMKKLEIYAEDSGAKQSYVSNTYSSLGLIYKRIGDYEKSIDAYERALGNLRSFPNARKEVEIQILNSLASAEIHLGNLKNARLHLDEAIAIENENNVLTKANLVRLYDANATYYQANNEVDKHLEYLKKTYISSQHKSLVKSNFILWTAPRYIDQLINSKELPLAHQTIDSTLSFIQENSAQITNSEQILATANLDALRAKLSCADGNIESALTEGLDVKLQKHALQIIKLAASTQGKKNQRYACTSCFGVSDILETLTNFHLEANSQGIDKEGNHLQKAFAALDIKQRFLTKLWDNKYFSSLPPKERNHAKEIRQRIAAYDLMIFENAAKTQAAQKQNALYLDSILVLRPILAGYIEKLNTASFDFNRSFDFNQLGEDQAVLAYHKQDSTIHILSATKNGLAHFTVPNASKVREDIDAYSAFCRNESKGFSESISKLDLGLSLYSSLVPEAFRTNSRLAIIEAYPVEELPFAALLTASIAKDARGFRDVPFAVQRHAFSYHQSPSDFFEAQAKSYYSKNSNLTALAPSQISSSPIASSAIASPSSMGLAYATQEVEALIKKFKGSLLTGQQADLSGLINAFKSSSVVHIASHATSNISASEYSYIIISDTSSMSGERLYARTISELDLPANLVVLGACESGSGKLQKGEGVMSLSNIFLNAGTQSVLHTGWRVEDKKSQDILLGFYDGFTAQEPLDNALVQAQRSYLQKAGGQYLHPFYWAPFEVSGNLSSMESSGNILLYGGIFLSILLMGYLFWRSR